MQVVTKHEKDKNMLLATWRNRAGLPARLSLAGCACVQLNCCRRGSEHAARKPGQFELTKQAGADNHTQ